jgi:hypothetical protein
MGVDSIMSRCESLARAVCVALYCFKQHDTPFGRFCGAVSARLDVPRRGGEWALLFIK